MHIYYPPTEAAAQQDSDGEKRPYRSFMTTYIVAFLMFLVGMVAGWWVESHRPLTVEEVIYDPKTATYERVDPWKVEK